MAKKSINFEETKSNNSLNQILELNKNEGDLLNPQFPTIEVDKYTKRFRKFVAAENVSLKVGHGVIHGFIGPNGAGKTTTIKAMIGAYIPTSGRILINGKIAGSVEANRLIGYIPERASFPKHLNSFQYLVAMGQLSGVKAKDARDRATSILKSLGLQEHARRAPIKFSSGMQKKILLAQSLMTNPKILILDEPAANLDPTARKELFDQLIQLRDQGKTILISSHILAELERIIDEVSFVYYGEVIMSSPMDKLNQGNSSVYIKAFDNLALTKFLTSKGYKVIGDLKTEIEINNISRPEAKKVFKLISDADFDILSFRSNDLQSLYDKLIEQAIRDKRGRQSLDGSKVVALNEAEIVKGFEEVNLDGLTSKDGKFKITDVEKQQADLIVNQSLASFDPTKSKTEIYKTKDKFKHNFKKVVDKLNPTTIYTNWKVKKDKSTKEGRKPDKSNNSKQGKGK